MNTKAYIKRDTENSNALWLVIEGEDNTAHPINEDEVEAIKKACEEWLENKK